MKFVVLTDTHFVARGRRIYGLDPAERLAAAIACINRDHPDLAFVILPVTSRIGARTQLTNILPTC